MGPGTETLRQPRVLAAAALLAVVVVGGIYMAGPDTPDEPATAEVTTFPMTWSPSSYVRHWALDRGHIAFPEGVEWVDPVSFLKQFEMAHTGEADTGFIPIVQLPDALESNPDIRLLDYGESFNRTWNGLYTREGSDIETLEDLENRTIAVHTSISLGTATMIALHESGVDVDSIEVLNKPREVARSQLESGAVDAAFVGRPVPDSYRPLLFPVEYWEETHGHTFHIAPWFIDGMDHYENGVAAAITYNRSMVAGYNNVTTAMEAFNNETGQGLERDEVSTGYYIERISEDEWDTVQLFLDRAYEYGYMDEQLDVESLRTDASAQ